MYTAEEKKNILDEYSKWIALDVKESIVAQWLRVSLHSIYLWKNTVYLKEEEKSYAEKRKLIKK